MFTNPFQLQDNDPFRNLKSKNPEHSLRKSTGHLGEKTGNYSDNNDFFNTHLVKPHSVKGYDRQDGTTVEGYWRDGDGNASINSTLESGGGYLRTNSDESIINNIG